MLWYPRIFSFNDFFVQPLHIICSERRDKSTHFIQDTPERPNVTFWIVRHISPHFWTRIVRSTCLSVWKTFFDNFWNIQIAKFCLHISVQKNVCTFHISMQDLSIMKSFKSSNNLYENVPYFLFFYVSFPLLITAYFLEHISIISIFHDETISL